MVVTLSKSTTKGGEMIVGERSIERGGPESTRPREPRGNGRRPHLSPILQRVLRRDDLREADSLECSPASDIASDLLSSHPVDPIDGGRSVAAVED